MYFKATRQQKWSLIHVLPYHMFSKYYSGFLNVICIQLIDYLGQQRKDECWWREQPNVGAFFMGEQGINLNQWVCKSW